MGRIKWNLDLLEDVKKQHGEAMTATEQVINNGKSDLSSMTEEVWEGEDTDEYKILFGGIFLRILIMVILVQR
jgi:uncharacterized protein YukE